MERHPFIVTMRAYLDGIQSTVGQATLRERESKLLYLFEVMLELRLSPDPRTMDKEEIDALVLWMRERNLGLAYQAKLWQYLRGLFAFVGNNILDVMKARGQWKPPKRAYRPVIVKDDGWFAATVASLANETGWRPRMVLAATAIYYHTGLRPKELRLAALRDLDLQRWILTVRHPNDEGGYYSEPGWRMARYKVFRSLGIDANYKVLRASFAQKLKDHGAPIENVSMALRHQTVVTTEQFYARVRTDRAWDALEELWSKPEVRLERKLN